MYTDTICTAGLGRYNTEEEVKYASKVIVDAE
jgi:hypothetical protein